ncbi:unnamed protein product [Caenorhabditis auriculariae]|uniref:UDP-N-acetylglucosamine transporter n=1 Tax=Caenorhabditis auriculariae TaxID=2777116 RepID=A0A8S1HIY7_9PELO|nr:unnamed protein product [Caenorhabditis auriculariae]
MAAQTAVTPANLKLFSLVILIVQTTALVLTLRYSRTQSGTKYLSSTAVVLAEILKFFTCIFVLLRNHSYRWSSFQSEVHQEIFSSQQKVMDALKVAVPAVLYVIQNNLLFFALSKLDAATYQVTYQLKILTTAFFSVVLLSKSLNLALVQMPSDDSKKTVEHDSSDSLLGLGAVLLACFSSGFAGVYFEKILKGSQVSLWIRNLELAFFSIFGGFFMCWLYDWEAIQLDGFLQGYNRIIWVVVFLQAYGGLVIALVVKYADNILKGFAVSLSIILSSFMSWLLLNDFTPSVMFAVGATIVILSTFLYGYEPHQYRPIHSA